MGWDLDLLRLLVAHRTPWADWLAGGLMTAGMSPLAYVAALALCLVFGWRFNAWVVATAAIVSGILAVGLADVGKNLIQRPRPPASLALIHAGGFAMPSSIGAMTLGAAMPIVVFGLQSATRAGRLLAVLLIAAVAVTGLSMVYLGAHWASDVLAGWALGAVVGAVTLLALTKVVALTSRAVR